MYASTSSGEYTPSAYLPDFAVALGGGGMDTQLVRGNLDLVLLSILEDGEAYGLEISKAAGQGTDGFLLSTQAACTRPCTGSKRPVFWSAPSASRRARGQPCAITT